MSTGLELGWDGSLVVLEGIDCCGKGRQIGLLADKSIELLGDDSVVTTMEPWRNAASPNGLWIDRLLNADNLGIPKEVNPGDGKLLAEQFQTLYVADRYVHWVKLILPALLEGKLVISDRERMSTFAYGLAFGLSLKEMASWHSLIPTPDITVWIDIPVDEAIKRKEFRQGPIEHFEDHGSMRLVDTAYRAVYDSGIIPNVVRIDGQGTWEEVHNRIWEKVLDYTVKGGE